jgi:hypothetical protein
MENLVPRASAKRALKTVETGRRLRLGNSVEPGGAEAGSGISVERDWFASLAEKAERSPLALADDDALDEGKDGSDAFGGETSMASVGALRRYIFPAPLGSVVLSLPSPFTGLSGGTGTRFCGGRGGPGRTFAGTGPDIGGTRIVGTGGGRSSTTLIASFSLELNNRIKPDFLCLSLGGACSS